MLSNTIDRWERRLAPHTRAITIAAAIWFWLGIAIQARFLPLPGMPRELELAIFWLGAAFNAVWWGFMRPAIDKRRKARDATEIAAPER